MAGLPEQPEPKKQRRGLHVPHIQRGEVARLAIRTVRAARRGLLLSLEVLLAGIILFEEWGWRPLSAALASLARIRIVARLEAAIAGLPPWPALAVFMVPSLLFLPLKLAALWLIAGGHVVWATGLFVFAKIGGTALYARIFQLTQPSLMQLPWFARGYAWFIDWKEHLVQHARQTAAWQLGSRIGDRVREALAVRWKRLKPVLVALAAQIKAALRR